MSNAFTQQKQLRVFRPAGPDGKGYLSMQLPQGRSVSLKLPARLHKPLLVLWEVRQEHAGLGLLDAAAGWLGRKEIARRIDQVLSAEALSAYVTALNRAWREALIDEGVPPFALIQCQRGSGMRLAPSVVLEINDPSSA